MHASTNRHAGPHARRFGRAADAHEGCGSTRNGEQREVVGSVFERDIGGQDVGTQGQSDVLGLLRRLEQDQIVLATRDLDVGADPAGRGEQERAASPARLECGDVGGEQIAEPRDGIRARDPDLPPGGTIEEGTLFLQRRHLGTRPLIHARPHPPAARAHRAPSAIIGTVAVPTTLLVTNDFPPRVGGIQRTLEALVRALPPDRVGVFCPSTGDPSRFDAEAPFRVFRQPEASLWPTRNVGRRVRAAARELGAEVVLFGATYPLALLGPRLAEDGYPYIAAAHGFEYWLSIAPGTHAAIRRATSHASRVAVMCSAFIARTVRTAVPVDVPVSVLFPGAEVERFRPDHETDGIRRTLGVGERPPGGCVSSVGPHNR